MIEIILLGYIVNVIILIFMFIIGVSIILTLHTNVEGYFITHSIEVKLEKLNFVIRECRRRKKFVYIQEDFIILLPFSYILLFLYIFHKINKIGYIEYIITYLDYKINKLEKRIKFEDK